MRIIKSVENDEEDIRSLRRADILEQLKKEMDNCEFDVMGLNEVRGIT